MEPVSRQYISGPGRPRRVIDRLQSIFSDRPICLYTYMKVSEARDWRGGCDVTTSPAPMRLAGSAHGPHPPGRFSCQSQSGLAGPGVPSSARYSTSRGGVPGSTVEAEGAALLGRLQGALRGGAAAASPSRVASSIRGFITNKVGSLQLRDTVCRLLAGISFSRGTARPFEITSPSFTCPLKTATVHPQVPKSHSRVAASGKACPMISEASDDTMLHSLLK
ncbi:unnamed protein product [Danaus chrysippus]|uniref:(African queen) hypothetical protein n=1 Tax=Danaus chrysippus TaxID=151541 RepID=A0A8J2W9F8_9NEOP|nr:unnamed protein product [Danaus chrysippus]